MKTNNDILAEYIKEKYPTIANSMDFALYRVTARLKETAQSVINTLSKNTSAESEGLNKVTDNDKR